MADLPRVLIHNDRTADLVKILLAIYPDVPFRECNSYDAVSDTISEFLPEIVYTVKFDGTPNFPRDAFFGCPSIKWISNGGVGIDHLGQWNPDEITVTNGAGVAAEMMAEYVIGGFLHFTLDVPGLQHDQESKIWRPRTVRPLKENTLLIVGLGSTGRALAKRAKAFGMRVIGTRATPRPMDDVDHVAAAGDLSSLLPEADFIAVSTPLTNSSFNLLDRAAFALMKNGVILADVSRGHIVQQSALLEALESRKVAAAILDVFEEEPLPPNNPLWSVNNVLISPHCSSVFEGWERASFDIFIDNLERWIGRKKLKNVVDPVRGY